jgi:hypothetical protein
MISDGLLKYSKAPLNAQTSEACGISENPRPDGVNAARQSRPAGVGLGVPNWHGHSVGGTVFFRGD